jgi:hypothetical protein
MRVPSSNREIVDELTLMSRLESLQTRQALFDVFWGAGSAGENLATRKAWEEGKPQEIGADIKTLVDNDVTVQISALNDAGLPRRQESVGRFSGLVSISRVKGARIQTAEVIGVTEIESGKRRMLPVLRLLEIGNPSEQEFALSVPDLAYYVRARQAAVSLR